MRGDAHVRFGGAGRGDGLIERRHRAPARPYSSTHSTMALSGGSRYSPMTSRTFLELGIGGEL